MIALVAFALAAEPDLHAAVAEALTTYSTQLSLGDAPPVYHLRYHLLEAQQAEVQASFGAMVYTSVSPLNLLGVELRLGDPSFDNMGFGGWQDGLGRARLPQVPTEHAVRVTAWELTDGAYKEAVEQYARKKAQVPDRKDHPGDYTMTGPVQRVLPSPPVVEPDGLNDLAVRLSGAWTGGPQLDRADVYVGHEAGVVWTTDTEGTSVERPVHETTIRAAAHLRTADGEVLTDHMLWTTRSPKGLPDEAIMRSQVQQVRDRLAAVAKAPPLADEYVGPVVFEDEAATDFFRYLLPSQLEGTPAEIPFDTWFGDLGRSADSVRIGRRVLPPGWRVTDDPSLVAGHPGAYTHDWEGTPTQAVELVEDGIVRTLAMSRTPRKGLEKTNGHGLGSVGQRAQGKVTMLSITPSRQLAAAKLRKAALKAAKAYGYDYVMVVRRLQVPAVQKLSSSGSFMLFGGSDEASLLPPPVDIVRLYADGREERVRGVAFSGVQRFMLRDILGAGPQQESSAMSPTTGDWQDLGPTQGAASFTRAPSVLIGEMELVPSAGDPRDVPVLPYPDIFR